MSVKTTTEKFPDWERPWTTDEIRKNGHNWTLAGDSGLFNRLQLVSQNMIVKSNDIQKNLDALVSETKTTNSRINNAVNEFLMLSNSQFVENRVYDEEIVDETTTEDRKTENDSEKTKEQRESELIPRISCALDLGLKVIDEKFEKHEVVDSESETEDGLSYVQMPLLEPKDLYLFRPLPYIIGSEKFMQNDKVGLIDGLSDEENEESDHDSLSESETSLPEKPVPPQILENDSESEIEIKQPIKSYESKESIYSEKEIQASDTDDFFGTESSSQCIDSEDDTKENDTKKQKQLPNKTNDPFANELASKLGVSSTTKKGHQGVDKKKALENKKSNEDKEKKREQKDELFSENYEENDDDDALFSNTKGLFSGGGNLFDSLGDDEDLFSEIVKKTEAVGNAGKVRGSKIPTSKDTPRSSSTSDEKSSITSSSLLSAKPKEKRKPSLFDDEDEDESDIFTSSRETNLKFSKRDEPSSTPNTMNSNEPSLFDNEIVSGKEKEISSADITPKKTLPAGARSLFGDAVNPMIAALKSRALHLEKESHDEGLSVDKERSDSISSKSSLPVQRQHENDTKAQNSKNSTTAGQLFAEEANSVDVFSQQPSRKNHSHPVSLFDDDSEDSDILFSPSHPSSKTETKSALLSEKTQKDLFANESSKDGEKSTSEPEGSQAKEKNEMRSKNKFPKGKFSLFNDDDDDDSDIFSGSSIKEDRLSSLPTEKSKNIFADDELLFSETFDDLPTIDIFKTDDVKLLESNEGSTNESSNNPISRQLSTGINLFGDAEDDIFTPKVKEQKLSGKPPIPTPRKASLPKDDVKGKSDSADGMMNVKKVETESFVGKPVGGVALFPGLDPFGGNTKDFHTEAETPAKIEKTHDTPSKPVDDSSLTFSAVTKQVKTEETAVSFDNPITVNPLVNMGKDRVRVQTKRRLPSRKNRHEKLNKSIGDMSENAIDEHDGGKSTIQKEIFKDLVTENEKTSKSQPAASDISQIQSTDLISPKLETLAVNGSGIVTSPSTEEDDLFSLTEQVAPALISTFDKLPRKDLPDIYPSESEDNGEENNIFFPVKSKVDLNDYNILQGKMEEKLKIKENDSDGNALFPSASEFLSSSKEVDIFAADKITSSPNRKMKTKKSLFDDDDSDSDDLFTDHSSKKGLKNRSSMSSSTKSSLTRTSKNKAQQSLFGDSDDNDDLDIFCDSSMTKK